MSLSDELRSACADVWEAQHSHPFVRGIGDGSLSLERFRHYLRQDYLFLIEYARLLSLGAARAPTLAQMSGFSELAHAILDEEMELHRGFAGELGISIAELEDEAMAPTTRGYTDFLVRVASTGDFAELVAALLPCMWGYAEIGQRLSGAGKPDDERYSRWIEMYAGDDFAQLASWCRELTDSAGAQAAGPARARILDVFRTSSRYELAFWQAAWDLERWPV